MIHAISFVGDIAEFYEIIALEVYSSLNDLQKLHVVIDNVSSLCICDIVT